MPPPFKAALRVPRDLAGLAMLRQAISRSWPARPNLAVVLTDTATPSSATHLRATIQQMEDACRDVVTCVVGLFRSGAKRQRAPLLLAALGGHPPTTLVPTRRGPHAYHGHRRPARPTLVAVLTYGTPPPASLRVRLQHLDDWYQLRMERLFTTLVQRHQQQHRATLGEVVDVRALPSIVKQRNRQIAYAAVACGMAISGSWVLHLASLGINLYLSSVVIQLGVRDTWRKRRLTERGKSAAVLVLLLGTGMLGVASADAFLEFTIERLTLMAQQQTEQQIRNVFGQIPAMVACLQDGQIVIVPREQLQAGDIVVVAAGTPVPVDGVVVAGTASIDQHALTGEAQPVERGPGERVLAATVVLMGTIHVRADQIDSETLVARITTILKKTQSYHSQIVSQGERLGDAMVIPTLLAGLVALPLRGLSSMLAVWMIPIGGLIRTTGAMTMIAYLDMTARSNILVKDGRSLDLLRAIDTVVFDKTGTLTHEQLVVDAVYTVGAFEQDHILVLAAAVEADQIHPIATAIRAAADARQIPIPTATATHVYLGYGVGVEVAGQVIQLGSQRYMDACGFPIPPDLAAVAARRAMQGKTTVYLAVAGVVQGATGLAPSVRPEALALITALRMRGLQLVMLTGDQFAPAQALAARLGIDHVFAEVLPAQKAALIMRLQRQGRRVLFVGDGINDGIALKQATVSVSLLGATTVATDMAQIVLMDQNLRQLDNLFELGRRFERDMQVQLGLAVATDLLTIGGVFTAGLGIAGAYGIAYAILLPATAYAFRVMWRQERLDPPAFEALPTHNAYPVPAADYGEEDRAYLFSD